jgi:ABC-type transport system involved in Fe-S cluster assembly fused permease/ATPase subunit
VLFNNQHQEVQQYDSFLAQYQLQMNRIERLGAQLNAGQAIILNCGIAAALGAAVMRAPGGTGVLPGDLVLIHGMLLQLWAPLQFLGWFWRCATRRFQHCLLLLVT